MGALVPGVSHLKLFFNKVISVLRDAGEGARLENPICASVPLNLRVEDNLKFILMIVHLN